MKVLVTGASGFLGSHVAERLKKRGDDVRVLVRKSSNKKFLDTLGVEYAYGAIEDAAAVEEAVKGVEAIVHSAGIVKARTEDEFFATNVQGTRNILEAARKEAPGLRRFVHVSSLEASGPSADGRPVSASQETEGFPRLADNEARVNVAGTDRPNPEMTGRVREEALKRNLILLTCGVYGNVIRFLAPLTIQDEVFDEALDTLEASIRAARA